MVAFLSFINFEIDSYYEKLVENVTRQDNEYRVSVGRIRIAIGQFQIHGGYVWKSKNSKTMWFTWLEDETVFVSFEFFWVIITTVGCVS